MMEADDPTDSDTESVCSTTSASSFSSEKRTKVFIKFSPSITTDQLYDHFASNGFDKTKVEIRRLTNRATGKPNPNAVVLTTSREDEIISLLNGTVIMGKCTLTVEPICPQNKKPIRKSASALSMPGASPEIVTQTCKGIALSTESESCRVFVGARLPEYVTEQHIREHFREFSHAISKVDSVRDKHTNASKGYFFVTFQTEAYANMAIRTLNQSLLLGKHKLKVELQKSYPNSSTLNPDQNLCYPVKITKLPVSVSDEALNALFSQAGEIIGRPIFHSSEQPYAHVNFKHTSGAQSAVQRFNGTIFCGREIRVSAQRPKAISQSTNTTSDVSLDQVPANLIKPKRDRANEVKVLSLDSRQWNQLMTMQGNGTSLYQEVVSPFKANPNVIIETEIASCAIKVSGTPEAVSSALDHVKSYIYKELQITERIKLEALVEIYPNLPDEIHEKHAVTIRDFEKSTMVLRFDGPSPGKVSAWTDVNDLLSSAHVSTFDVSFSIDLVPSFRKRLQIDRIQAYIKVCKDPPQITICSFDESMHKQAVKLVQSQPFERSINALPHVIEKIFTDEHAESIQKELTALVMKSETEPRKLLVQGFCWESVKTACDKLIRLVHDISKEKKLTREESLYLKHGCENYPDQFIGVQIKHNRGPGGNVEVLGDHEKFEKYLSGLMCKRYTFKRRFQQQITSIILHPLREEKCLDFIYIFEPSPQPGRLGPTSKVKEETFQVLVYSKDQSSFNEVCGSLDTIKPTSYHYRFRYHPRDSVQQVKLIKSELESTYHVYITERERERGAYINGLKPDDVHKCRDIIDEAIRSKVIITKTISDAARHELKYIERRYGGQFEDEYDCKVYFHKDCDEVQIEGKIKNVEALEGRIKELIEAEVYVESFSISCIEKHFGMWKERWMMIEKEQEESEVIMDFIRKDRRRSSSSSSSESKQEIEVQFEIIGPDPDQLLEIKELLCKKEMEKRILDISPAGITALISAKRQRQFNRFAVDMDIDKRMNKVTLQSPQGLSEDIETAELEIRKFVGSHASIHKDLTCEEPIVGLVLSSKTKSVPYLATANSFARVHGVVVHSLRPPQVGLRLKGNSSAVSNVHEFVQANVIKQIEASIREETLSICQKYSTVLSSYEFTRFEAKLKQDYCIICSYPQCGQLSKATHSALINSLSHPVRVDICRGNVVQEKVDAIVNAANVHLKHVKGLPKAISDAGGPSIQTESNSYVQINGKVPAGECVVLGAGALPCKRIIHAVGPRWVDGTKNEEETLYFTVLNCLQQASKENLSSVAFPAISTGSGVFGMPEDICAKASLKAVYNYLQGNQNSTVTAIRFVLCTQTAFQAFKSSFKSIILPCATKQETMDCNSKVIIVLRGPRESLQEAKAKVEEKLNYMLKSQNISFPIDMEEKLLQIIAKHRVTSFIREVGKDTKGKSSKQLKQICIEGTSLNVQRAITAIQEEIIQHQLESKEENEEEYPQEWEDQAQTVKVFLVQQGNPEWNKVVHSFKTTMPNSTIIQISRIQNTWLWERYVFQSKRLGIKNGGSINERDLFHGTRSNDPRVIYENEDGFDMRYSAQGMWGQANYFAVNASYSHNYAHATPDGAREMFLVKVLTGDSYDCPPNSSLRKPPMKASGHSASGEVSFAQVQYDTVTGVTNGSRVYMIYDNDKAYPAYLIKYK